jgi:hypothetical protein
MPFIGLFVVALAMITYIPGITVNVVEALKRREAAAEAARARASGMQTNSQTTNVVPSVADGGAGSAADGGAGNCDEQGENESFEEFDRRCNITGNHPEANAGGSAGGSSAATPAAAPAIPADCNEQRENESFDDFDRRCNITGRFAPEAGTAAQPAPAGDASTTDAAAVPAATDAAAAPAH